MPYCMYQITCSVYTVHNCKMRFFVLWLPFDSESLLTLTHIHLTCLHFCNSWKSVVNETTRCVITPLEGILVNCIKTFIPHHRKYSQSESRKAIAYLTVLQPSHHPCIDCVGHYGMVLNSYATLSLGIQCTMEYPTCHLHFLRIHTHLKACVSTEKMQVTCGMFHGIFYDNCRNSRALIG